MLLYPILEVYFRMILAMPSLVLGGIIIGLIVLGIFGFSDIRNAILTILGAPLALYLICYGCKIAQGWPFFGWVFIIIRFAIDVAIIGGIIMIIKYFSVK